MNLRRTAPSPAQRKTHHFATLAALLALAGCGGGGGGGGNADAGSAGSTSTTGTTTGGTTTTPVTTAGTRLTCNLANFQTDMLAAVNARRRAGATCGANGSFPAAPDLAWNATLTQAAAAHSDDMVANNYFSHTGSDGSTLGTRATAAGYVWSGLGENIAAGQATVADVVDAWMKSDGHCANLMNASYKDIGVACVAGGASNTYRTYWTQDFGTPR
ncbi:CAP domain-containing protein [Roseateles sp. BYS78W]|uniref:CAP domain-containing protein n=1 Tax=Pelomonas candidula TaxID=3299025 RepID=A0ABW7HHH5_9BURK